MGVLAEVKINNINYSLFIPRSSCFITKSNHTGSHNVGKPVLTIPSHHLLHIPWNAFLEDSLHDLPRDRSETAQPIISLGSPSDLLPAVTKNVPWCAQPFRDYSRPCENTGQFFSAPFKCLDPDLKDAKIGFVFGPIFRFWMGNNQKLHHIHNIDKELMCSVFKNQFIWKQNFKALQRSHAVILNNVILYIKNFHLVWKYLFSRWK